MAAEDRYITKVAGRLDGTEGAEVLEAIDRPALRLPVRMLDRFLGAFRPGTATLLDSAHPYVTEMVAMLCVQAVGELGGEVLYVDGGNSFDPYSLLAHARLLGVDRDIVLDNIRVARAFTAHQLTSLLHDSLPKALEERTAASDRPITVVVSQIADLYTDRDVGRSEARGMLGLSSKKLVEATASSSAVTLVSNFGLSKLGTKGAIRRALYGQVHRVIRIERTGPFRDRAQRMGPGGLRWHPVPRKLGRDSGRMVIHLPSEGRSLVYHPAPRDQRTLDDFEPERLAVEGGP
jgi:hypothetical protein